MFSYSCEKCGREVPPAYSECPDCAAKEGRSGVTPATATGTPQTSSTAGATAATGFAMGTTMTSSTMTPPMIGLPQQPAAAPPPPAQGAPVPPPPSAAPPSLAAPSPIPAAQQTTAQRPMAPPAPASGTPGWLIAVLTAALLILGGYLLIDKGLPWYRARNNPDLAFETPPTAAPAEAANAAPTPGGASDVVKFLQVTGLRITESNRKPQISMVVVNHAAAELNDIRADVLVRTTKDAPGAAPLAKLDLKLGSIGPNEVRDITMPFPTSRRAYELPDWQFLTAEVAAK